MDELSNVPDNHETTLNPMAYITLPEMSWILELTPFALVLTFDSLVRAANVVTSAASIMTSNRSGMYLSHELLQPGAIPMDLPTF